AAADADVRVGEVEDAAGRAVEAGDLAARLVRAAIAAADVDDPAVGSDRQAVGLTGVLEVARGAVDQALALVVLGHGRLAVGADETGGPLDRAEQVVLNLGHVEDTGGLAEGGVEGAAALEVVTPGELVVGARDVRAV